MRLNWLLIFIPVALVLDWYGSNPIVVFGASALALVPLAALMGEATDALADFVGPTWGGLLSASLGNAPEIITQHLGRMIRPSRSPSASSRCGGGWSTW
jgi:Ca2+:H+ antiporter